MITILLIILFIVVFFWKPTYCLIRKDHAVYGMRMPLWLALFHLGADYHNTMIVSRDAFNMAWSMAANQNNNEQGEEV